MRIVLPLLLLVVLLTAWGSRSSVGSAHPLDCKIESGSIIVSFGATKHPTYFGIETPDDRFVYIRYPPKKIDVLGDDYYKREVSLSLRDLSGFVINNGTKSPARVFDVNGKYRLIFQDANTAYGVDLHELSCAVRISDATAKIEPISSEPATSCSSSPLVHASANGKLSLTKQKFDVGAITLVPAGCGPAAPNPLKGSRAFAIRAA
ncbi:MAG TPA: hypothetical protein VFI32_02250 [Rhodanobacteraceae bacterium]|nr:hypothetical protein [Rhodanobacteraceae bacterium]